LLSDDDAEADSFIGQSAVPDHFNLNQFGYFSQNGAVDVSDPFSHVRQPEVLPVSQSLLLNKPSPLPQFGLSVNPQQAHSTATTATASVNPYAAGAAIVSARPSHFISPGVYRISISVLRI
jgi:hypothetical protein